MRALLFLVLTIYVTQYYVSGRSVSAKRNYRPRPPYSHDQRNYVKQNGFKDVRYKDFGAIDEYKNDDVKSWNDGMYIVCYAMNV